MTKRDAFLMYGALGISVLLALAAISIPTSPGPFQRAINDRDIKVQQLRERGYTVLVSQRGNSFKYDVSWKDETGEPFTEEFVIFDQGDQPVAYGPGMGDHRIGLVGWYEVGE